MDGCMVAYHNTSRMFGFQYVTLKEMDNVLSGSSYQADLTFRYSLYLLQTVLQKVTLLFPEQVCHS